MTYLLDTNVLIGLMARKASLVVLARRRATGDLLVPVIVLFELLFGIARSARPEHNQAQLAKLRFPILPLTEQDAHQAAEIRAGLANAGTPIGPYDTLIAAQARARDLTLVTRNICEFERIPGLKLENWEA